MASSAEKVIERLQVTLKAKATYELGRKQFQTYADFLAEDIKKRTRLGYGAKYDKKFKLQKLAKSTVERRQVTATSQFTKPSKSNLSETGSMVDAIKGLGHENSGVVYIEDSPRPGNRSNNEIANFHEYGGERTASNGEIISLPARPFLHFDELQRKRLTDFIRRDLLGKVQRTVKKITES